MRRLPIVGLVLLVAACVITKTTSFVDPAYRNAPAYRSVIVVAVGMGLEDSIKAENELSTAFGARGVTVYRGIDLVPPTRNLSDAERATIFESSGAEAVLIFATRSESVNQSYVPPTYHPGTSTSYVSFIGNTAYVSTSTSPGFTTGGYTISKPRATHVAHVIDIPTGETVWKGEAKSRGSAFASFDDLMASAGKQFAERLREDRIF